jgi:hypothetical protein
MHIYRRHITSRYTIVHSIRHCKPRLPYTPSSTLMLGIAATSMVVGLTGCVVVTPPPAPSSVVLHPSHTVMQVPAPVLQPTPVYIQESRIAHIDYQPSVMRVYVEPPQINVEIVVVPWAPPPMLIEPPPPTPSPEFFWVGGYWIWQDGWVWAIGRWMRPPRPDLHWEHPYYEHRGDAVIFVPGHWDQNGHRFEPPQDDHDLRRVPVPRIGHPGRPPEGPQGVFVPPPPGSRLGLIVPAPVGTAPAVVTSAPAITAVGMRVQGHAVISANVNNVHVTNVTNVTNITIVAPAGTTANGQSYSGSVPNAPHLAANIPMHPSNANLVTTAPTAPAAPVNSTSHQPSVGSQAMQSVHPQMESNRPVINNTDHAPAPVSITAPSVQVLHPTHPVTDSGRPVTATEHSPVAATPSVTKFIPAAVVKSESEQTHRPMPPESTARPDASHNPHAQASAIHSPASAANANTDGHASPNAPKSTERPSEHKLKKEEQ